MIYVCRRGQTDKTEQKLAVPRLVRQIGWDWTGHYGTKVHFFLSNQNKWNKNQEGNQQIPSL